MLRIFNLQNICNADECVSNYGKPPDMIVAHKLLLRLKRMKCTLCFLLQQYKQPEESEDAGNRKSGKNKNPKEKTGQKLCFDNHHKKRG